MKACFQIAEHCLTTAKINLIFVTSKLLERFLIFFSAIVFVPILIYSGFPDFFSKGVRNL